MDYKIVLNMCSCNGCGRVLLSQSRHDFRPCKCGTFTDGGREYIRRGGDSEDFTVVLTDDGLRFLKDMDNNDGC